MSEPRKPYIVDGKEVTQRRLPDGKIVGKWSCKTPAEAEKFVTERTRQHEKKGYEIGDDQYGDE